MTHILSVKTAFETAHRLPQLGGKCANLHGHSWTAEFSIVSDTLVDTGIVIDIGTVKQVLRTWVDDWLDHGVMLAAADHLVTPLREAQCKVYRFGADVGLGDCEEYARYVAYPTVEGVAEMLFNMAYLRLAAYLPGGAEVGHVRVQEKHDNAAVYAPPLLPRANPGSPRVVWNPDITDGGVR